MYYYVWKGDNNNGWPGAKATYVKLNEYGQGIFSCQVDKNVYSSIIFNNGNGSQSPEISLASLTNNTGIYIDGGAVHTYPYSA